MKLLTLRHRSELYHLELRSKGQGRAKRFYVVHETLDRNDKRRSYVKGTNVMSAACVYSARSKPVICYKMMASLSLGQKYKMAERVPKRSQETIVSNLVAASKVVNARPIFISVPRIG